MTWLRVLLSRVCGLFGGRRRDAALRDEIEAHLDLIVRDHRRHGMSVDDARAAARRDFGPLPQLEEAYRDRRGVPVARRRELAVRRALGASRSCLVRQMLAESVTLCGAGAAVGVPIAYGILRLLLLAAPADVPRLDEVSIDMRVLAAAVAVSTVIGILVGLLPAWRCASVSDRDTLTVRPGGSSDGPATTRLRSLLVSGEVAVSAACLIAAGLLFHSLANITRVEKGFDAERVVTTTVSLPANRYPTVQRRAAFGRAVLDRLSGMRLPVVGLSSQLPLTGQGSTSAISSEGTAVPLLERPLADVRAVNADYFRVMAVPLVSGRIFSDADGDRSVALVSDVAARRAWPGQPPIGQRFRFGSNPSGPLVEVIGVVGDIRGVSLDREPAITVYVPFWQRESTGMSFAIRTFGDYDAASITLGTALRDVDPDLPIPSARTMDDVVGESTAGRRFQLQLVALFAGASLLLATLGIYGVLSHAVLQRTNEIGIRLALGARPNAVRRMVLVDAIRIAGAGLASGAPLGLAAAQPIRALLYGVPPHDPLTIAGTCAALSAAALAAAYGPARRASRVQPAIALRSE